jgi:hypothetical protein
LRDGKEREVENALADVRLPPMDEVGQIGDPDGIDLFTGEEDIEDGVHSLKVIKSESCKVKSVETR